MNIYIFLFTALCDYNWPYFWCWRLFVQHSVNTNDRISAVGGAGMVYCSVFIISSSDCNFKHFSDVYMAKTWHPILRDNSSSSIVVIWFHCSNFAWYMPPYCIILQHARHTDYVHTIFCNIILYPSHISLVFNLSDDYCCYTATVYMCISI